MPTIPFAGSYAGLTGRRLARFRKCQQSTCALKHRLMLAIIWHMRLIPIMKGRLGSREQNACKWQGLGPFLLVQIFPTTNRCALTNKSKKQRNATVGGAESVVMRSSLDQMIIFQAFRSLRVKTFRDDIETAVRKARTTRRATSHR